LGSLHRIEEGKPHTGGQCVTMVFNRLAVLQRGFGASFKGLEQPSMPQP
jgi:hypothetical protein